MFIHVCYGLNRRGVRGGVRGRGRQEDQEDGADDVTFDRHSGSGSTHMESRHEGQEVPGASGRMGRPDIAYRNEDSTQILRRRYGDPCSVQ